MRRNSSLKHVSSTYNVSSVEESKERNDRIEKHTINICSNILKDAVNEREDKPVDSDDEKEEVKISGCRRRIMNRPNKRNSKSKSFCEQRKFRSHSPMPERKQNLNEQSIKVKVLCPLN